ncbi:MAG: serine hydrolase domain-containing protein [Candidatus Sulfotelmatobacter sp.]
MYSSISSGDSLTSSTPSTAATSLLASYDEQDQIFSSAFSILDAALSAHAFPAASAAITHRGRLIALKAFGRFTYESDPMGARMVSAATLFDLASLTKVVATTTVAMLLYERGILELEVPVSGVIPEFLRGAVTSSCDPRRNEVTFRKLLAHSSGLPAYEKLFLKHATRDELLQAAFTTPLTADPGTHAEYSDIGFVILGAALERLAGESLDQFCQREIFGPLGMTNTTFNPPAELRAQIPPTAKECGADARSNFRNRIIQGEVQDENASVLGGIAGHAGLFSTAGNVARFAHAMLNGGRPILRPETVALFTRREAEPASTSRTLGWDTPSAPSQSGKYFGPASFGHLGYTGTSLWIDPDRQLSIALLTNRTWPDCSNQAIKQVRPQFHDAVMDALNRSL